MMVLVLLPQLSRSVCPLPVGTPDSVRILGSWTGWSCNGVMQLKSGVDCCAMFYIPALISFIPEPLHNAFNSNLISWWLLNVSW